MRFVSSFVLAFVVGLAMASNKAEASFVTIGDGYWSIYHSVCAGQPEEDWWDCAWRDSIDNSNFVERTAEADGAYAGYSAGGSVSQTSATADLVTVSAEFTETAYSFANDDSVFAFAGGTLYSFGLSFNINEEVDAFISGPGYLWGTDQEFSGNIFSGLLSPGTYGFDFFGEMGFSTSSLSGPAYLGGWFGVASSGVGYASSSSSTSFNFSFARVYAVPEPHTAMMLGLGLVTLALARRRQSMRTLS